MPGETGCSWICTTARRMYHAKSLIFPYKPTDTSKLRIFPRKDLALVVSFDSRFPLWLSGRFCFDAEWQNCAWTVNRKLELSLEFRVYRNSEKLNVKTNITNWIRIVLLDGREFKFFSSETSISIFTFRCFFFFCKTSLCKKKNMQSRVEVKCLKNFGVVLKCSTDSDLTDPKRIARWNYWKEIRKFSIL